MIDFSIVVPHYHRADMLRALLASIAGQRYDRTKLEVIVVADAASARIEHVNGLQHRTITLDRHAGAAHAKNAGAQAARHEWLVFLDDDVVLATDWFESMMTAVLRNPSRSCFQSKVCSQKNRQMLLSAGGVANIFGYSWDRGAHEPDDGRYAADRAILYASSCAMVINRTAFNDIGRFDDDIFYMGEDYDLGMRMHMRGGTVVYVPEACCFHASDSSMNNDDVRYYLERNRWYVVLKNYELPLLCALAVPFCCLKVIKYISYLFVFKGKQLHYAARVCGGLGWVLQQLPVIARKRTVVARSRTVSTMAIMRLFPRYRWRVAAVK